MSVSDADIAFATELFGPLGRLTSRKMMGGLCLYSDGKLFAILDHDGQIYIRSKGDVAARLAESGAHQFGNMGYWSLPNAALDDADAACDWARRSLGETED